MHGCPHYGPAEYDEDGYNQEGYHRTTGLNREGRTRHEEVMQHEEREDEEELEDEDDEEQDEDHPVLRHLDADMRAVFAAIPRIEREAILITLQIQLFEEQGATFPMLPEGHEHADGEQSEDNGEEDTDTNTDAGGDADTGAEDNDGGGIGGAGQGGENEDLNTAIPPPIAAFEALEPEFVEDVLSMMRTRGPPGGWPVDREP